MDFTCCLIFGAYVTFVLIVKYYVYLRDKRRDSSEPLAKEINNNTENKDAENKVNKEVLAKDQLQFSSEDLKELIRSIVFETMKVSESCRDDSSGILSKTHSLHNFRNNSTRYRTEKYFQSTDFRNLYSKKPFHLDTDVESNILAYDDMKGNGFDTNCNLDMENGGSDVSSQSRNYSEQEDMESNYSRRLTPIGIQLHERISLVDGERQSMLSGHVGSHYSQQPDLISTTASENEDDDCASLTSTAIADNNNWDENWLLKERRSPKQSTLNTKILVPQPEAHVKTQIGDKIADEISDISDLDSECDSSLDNSALNILNERLENKSLIGGKNDKLLLDTLIEKVEDISKISAETITTFEAETPLQNESEEHLQILPPPKDFEDTQINSDSYEPIRIQGSIAEREHNKWNNAVEMPNNPYSPDALQNRIKGKTDKVFDLPALSPILVQKSVPLESETPQKDSDIFSIKSYSRDYYVNRKDLETLEEEKLKSQEGNEQKCNKDKSYKSKPLEQSEKQNIFKSSREWSLVKSSSGGSSDFSGNEQETSKTVKISTRRTTPMSFKFLTPKRRLIDPSQVLSLDETEPSDIIIPGEKSPIEEELQAAMPSVKALVQAFLSTAKGSGHEKMTWKKAARETTAKKLKSPQMEVKPFEPKPDDIQSENKPNSLEMQENIDPLDDSSESPVHPGKLKSNIEFFENLKFK